MRPSPLAALLATALAAPALALDCVPTTSRPEIDTGPNAPLRFYVDNDWCHECMFSIWVYQESNGIDGLQRADEVHDDTCGGMIKSDTIIW